jgi:hypothetical protein
MKISQGSLYEVSLYEVRKAFSDDTGYQTHPKMFGATKRIRAGTLQSMAWKVRAKQIIND